MSLSRYSLRYSAWSRSLICMVAVMLSAGAEALPSESRKKEGSTFVRGYSFRPLAMGMTDGVHKAGMYKVPISHTGY